MTLVNNNLYFNTLERKVILDKAIDILFDDATSTEQLTAFFQRFNCVCARYKNGVLVDFIEYVKKVYSYQNYCERWDEIFTHVHEKYGSWETRKNYKSWMLRDMS